MRTKSIGRITTVISALSVFLVAFSLVSTCSAGSSAYYWLYPPYTRDNGGIGYYSGYASLSYSANRNTGSIRIFAYSWAPYGWAWANPQLEVEWLMPSSGYVNIAVSQQIEAFIRCTSPNQFSKLRERVYFFVFNGLIWVQQCYSQTFDWTVGYGQSYYYKGDYTRWFNTGVWVPQGWACMVRVELYGHCTALGVGYSEIKKNNIDPVADSVSLLVAGIGYQLYW